MYACVHASHEPDVGSWSVCIALLCQGSMYDSVFNLFDIGPPAEGSESDIICALISGSLCNDNS